MVWGEGGGVHAELPCARNAGAAAGWRDRAPGGERDKGGLFGEFETRFLMREFSGGFWSTVVAGVYTHSFLALTLLALLVGRWAAVAGKFGRLRLWFGGGVESGVLAVCHRQAVCTLNCLLFLLNPACPHTTSVDPPQPLLMPFLPHTPCHMALLPCPPSLTPPPPCPMCSAPIRRHCGWSAQRHIWQRCGNDPVNSRSDEGGSTGAPRHPYKIVD